MQVRTTGEHVGATWSNRWDHLYESKTLLKCFSIAVRSGTPRTWPGEQCVWHKCFSFWGCTVANTEEHKGVQLFQWSRKEEDQNARHDKVGGCPSYFEYFRRNFRWGLRGAGTQGLQSAIPWKLSFISNQIIAFSPTRRGKQSDEEWSSKWDETQRLDLFERAAYEMNRRI